MKNTGHFFRGQLALLCLLLFVGCDRQASRLANERGMSLARFGQEQEDAMEHFNVAVELDPSNVMAYANRASLHLSWGEYDQAAVNLQKAIELDADGVFPFYTYNGLAWLRATCSSDKLRNGVEAVKLATKACELTDWKESAILDTLAAAYAENGDFDAAVKWQEQAIELAEPIYLEEFQGRLELFQSHRPYRE